MPKRTDIKKIMVISSGPIIIGQACEFDYSGTQACKALKEEGYSVVLVNSNPATIMTDPQMADRTYIEPLTVENMEKIIIEVVPVSGADAAYYFSTYNAKDSVSVSSKRKIMILGGGPNRIGQGIEFDYACVHAAFTLREEGVESIMVNCNPETVSTDYDTSNKLYFEPLTVEDVLSIYEKEKPEGVIVQFGGQTPLNIAKELYEAGIKIIGTSPESIHLAEDRQKFKEIIHELNIPQPESGVACSADEALVVANKIGYPLMVRPSFVLGGRGMQVVYNEKMLLDYVKTAIEVSPEYLMLIDKFLEEALEVEVDAISDGEDVYIPTVMEHIELAGIHSGDSACVIPARNISKENLAILEGYTKKIAKALKILATKGTKAYLNSNAIESELVVKLHEGRPNITDDNQYSGGQGE